MPTNVKGAKHFALAMGGRLPKQRVTAAFILAVCLGVFRNRTVADTRA